MLTKRIIPCLDVANGRVVKGNQFLNLVDSGDAVELAARYCQAGADELVLLDITATNERRLTTATLVSKVATVVDIPFTIGGGIRTLDQATAVLRSGADKVALNSAAIDTPELITQLAQSYGSQCVVVAIDVKKIGSSWQVFRNGGREATSIDVVAWAKQVTKLGAGEILLTSIDADGTQSGYDIEITRAVSRAVSVPVIASGGAGKLSDFAAALTLGEADAVLAARVFHTEKITIPALKKYLLQQKLSIRKVKNDSKIFN